MTTLPTRTKAATIISTPLVRSRPRRIMTIPPATKAKAAIIATEKRMLASPLTAAAFTPG